MTCYFQLTPSEWLCSGAPQIKPLEGGETGTLWCFDGHAHAKATTLDCINGGGLALSVTRGCVCITRVELSGRVQPRTMP